MKPLTRDELLSLEAYEDQRERRMREMIDYKKRCRRIDLGPRASLIFENRRTVRHQVQEMLRIERIFEPDRVQHELDVCNTMLPGPGELAATLMLQADTSKTAGDFLGRLKGIEQDCLFLVVGEAHRLPAAFEGDRSDGRRVSAVQYVRWRLSDQQRQDFADPEHEICLECRHPHYEATAVIPPPMRASLQEDLDAS